MNIVSCEGDLYREQPEVTEYNDITQLKPCPFCGSKASLFEYRWWGITYGVECSQCKGLIERCSTKEEAIKAWNRRVSDD